MNRRDLLKGLLATTAAPLLPVLDVDSTGAFFVGELERLDTLYNFPFPTSPQITQDVTELFGKLVAIEWENDV